MICVEEGSSVGINSKPQPGTPPVSERFQEIDLWDAPPSDLADLNKFVYAANDPVNGRDPSGHDLVGLLASMSIANMLNAIEFTGFTAAYDSARGVEAGQNANQVLESFLIQQAIGVGIGLGIGVAAAGWGALRNGISLDFNLFSRIDEFAPVSSAPAGEIAEVASPGAPLNLTNEFPGSAGEYLGEGRPNFKDLADLSRKNNIEYVLVYKVPQGSASTGGGGGSYTLYSGTTGRARFPIDENTRLIVHTHPGGTAGPSVDDIETLVRLNKLSQRQRSSQIIAVGDASFQVVRYNLNSTPVP